MAPIFDLNKHMMEYKKGWLQSSTYGLAFEQAPESQSQVSLCARARVFASARVFVFVVSVCVRSCGRSCVCGRARGGLEGQSVLLS